jgi:hypothetical protein
MSSWANRGIYSKRNLQQIPEALRPQIVPRYQRPEIVLSESFHIAPTNEIIYPTGKQIYDPIDPYELFSMNPRSKRVEILPSPKAVELKQGEKTYVFVILRNIQHVSDNDLWITSYNSIRKFYTNRIIIIDDHSSINTVNGKLINTEVIFSDFNGAGELLPYYYFMKEKWADRMIFIHDSMFLHRPFTTEEVDVRVRFHWHFEPNQFDNPKMISFFISLLKNKDALASYVKEHPTLRGCFGGTCVIDHSVIKEIEEKYNLFSVLSLTIRKRKDREVFERVLARVLFFEGYVTLMNCSLFGDIKDYPDAYKVSYIQLEENIRKINEQHYPTALIKIWRGR